MNQDRKSLCFNRVTLLLKLLLPFCFELVVKQADFLSLVEVFFASIHFYVMVSHVWIIVFLIAQL